jgi:hypothetical protein
MEEINKVLNWVFKLSKEIAVLLWKLFQVTVAIFVIAFAYYHDQLVGVMLAAIYCYFTLVFNKK